MGEFKFYADSDNWFLKINRDQGIVFNREKYPNSTPDDFAKAFMDILEKEFTVKFEKKNPPYDRKGND